MAESKVSQLRRENERLKDAFEELQHQSQKQQIKLHELEVKVDAYLKENERLTDESKRSKELVNQLREDKDSALQDLQRNKTIQHNRLTEVTDEANTKVAHLEQCMLEMKQKHKQYEEKAYTVSIRQEKLIERWKEEHRQSQAYYERVLKGLEVENRHLQDQCIELKGRNRALQGGQSTKSRERK